MAKRPRVTVLTDVRLAVNDADPRIVERRRDTSRVPSVDALSQITISRVAADVRSSTFSTHFVQQMDPVVRQNDDRDAVVRPSGVRPVEADVLHRRLIV